MSNLYKQIKNARKSLRALKKSAPYLFPEYIKMIDLEQKAISARKAADESRKKWEKDEDQD